MKKGLFLSFALMLCMSSFSQTRSGASAKTSGTADFFPCQGSAIFAEDFQAGLPAGAVIYDFDSLTPHPLSGLSAGWQIISDFRNPGDSAVASVSWYQPAGQSEDWLILPPFTTGTNTCFSWEAYSQDADFPEAYQVLISVAGIDTADFYANPILLTDSSLSNVPAYYSINLAAYPNTSVRIAFRQFSDDKYILVLDDMKATDVVHPDAAMLSFDSISAEAALAVPVSGTIINAGSSTLNQVMVNYSVDGGTVQSMLLDSIDLLPNESMTFTHDSLWTPDTTKVFSVCIWTSQPDGLTDLNLSNDTLCQQVNVVNFVSRDEGMEPAAVLPPWPNPVTDVLYFECLDEDRLAEIVNLQGQTLASFNIREAGKHQLRVSSLPEGMYFLKISGEMIRNYRIIIQ